MSNDSLFPEDVKERQRRVLAEAHAAKNAMTDMNQRYEDAVWAAGWTHGYDQGWIDGYQRAVYVMQEAASMRPSPPAAEPVEPVPGLPPKDGAEALTASEIILDLIHKFPGLRGFELVDATERAGTPLKERTVRTALYRLKNARKIYAHDERWFSSNAAIIDGDN